MSTLRVDEVSVRFGALVALDAVSFTVEPGTVHAVIGPNGAGKSTCLNVLSGVYRPDAGRVYLDDRELTRLRPHHIARLGIARTFQNIEVSGAETVEDNLMLGRHHLMRPRLAATAFGLPSVAREERRHRTRVREIADFLGLSAALDRPAALLPYGLRKRLELARALAMEPRLLLLDEPVAGMDGAETAEMADVILRVRTELGVTVVLVEHDMGMVTRIADRVTVLDFGRRIFDGSPAAMAADPAVVEAYLGGAPSSTKEPA
ncbi:ABC transporter ATP-binding protein [Planosporangium flavigriseum]|uniref:ABC transporter ATP-binding protein n=1 Tax=Planosporangium flavigriseum TaxID=373681 RepID=A0A8J3LRJ5_9ACTN|nr:ABC transporter ATP-binding protein [Planosporangium flavigriseum]NJC67862.1 ABC transporter ATP-binding protein [Planosporangium flavigriseum]GIG76319.1 ABC transporter ATP-binding protein [Planosporangium flavigriseum]